VDASQPTIFAAQTTSSNTVSPPILAGATGRNRHAIDLFPSAVMDAQGALWCAWDCSEPRRCIRLVRLDPATNAFKESGVFGGANEVCSTPELSSAGTNGLLLAWSYRGQNGRWQGKVALLKDGNTVAETVLAGDSDILFPQAQQAPDGGYWVACEKSGPRGSEIELNNITARLKAER
jgi:hypothetical protein